MPWSSGWITDVQLDGKIWALTLVKESKNSTEQLWPPTLSINNKTIYFSYHVLGKSLGLKKISVIK